MSELKYKGGTMYLGDKVDIDGNVIEIVDNPEFVKVETDSEDRILGGRRSDGRKFEEVGFETRHIDVGGNILEAIDSPEFLDVILDKEGRIIESINSKGEKVEASNVKYPNGIPDDIKEYVSKQFLMDVEKKYTSNRLYILSHIVNKQAKYIFNSYIPNKFSNLSHIDFGGIKELNIRTPANAIYSVARLIISGFFNKDVVGYDEKHCRKVISKLANALVASYDSWKHQWETSMWLGQVAGTMALLRDDYTTEEWSALRNAVISECDYLLSLNRGDLMADDFMYTTYVANWDRPWDSFEHGDTASDNLCFWNRIFCVAVLLFKDAPNYALYKRRMVEFALLATTTPSDKTSEDVYNGLSVASLPGYNMTDEGFVYNHDILHPDYMTVAVDMSGRMGSLYSYFNERIPNACLRNVDKYVNVLAEYEFTPETALHRGSHPLPPYGKILRSGYDYVYYPQGNDWGTERCYQLLVGLYPLHAIGFTQKVNLSLYADNILRRALYLIDRFEDGHMVANSTECRYDGGGYGAEMDAADVLSSAMFSLLYPPKFTEEDWYS